MSRKVKYAAEQKVRAAESIGDEPVQHFFSLTLFFTNQYNTREVLVHLFAVGAVSERMANVRT